MDDRELLELAAKATGGVFFESVGGFAITVDGKSRLWNPLTDDGDALRLAVNLGIDVQFHGSSVRASPSNPAKVGFIKDVVFEMIDVYEATRRAIVLVAAEIGRNMP